MCISVCKDLADDKGKVRAYVLDVPKYAWRWVARQIQFKQGINLNTELSVDQRGSRRPVPGHLRPRDLLVTSARMAWAPPRRPSLRKDADYLRFNLFGCLSQTETEKKSLTPFYLHCWPAPFHFLVS